LQDHGVQKVDEALRYTAGVLAQPFGSDSRADWAYIRGFDASQLGMYMNGLQLFQFAFAGITVDPFLIDRIEVLRGPASVLYGGSNAGGLIDLDPKLADGERIRYVEAGVDSNPNGYVAFDLGDKFSQDSDWSYRVLAKIKGGDTQTEYADNFRGVIAPSLLYRPDDNTKLELYGSYQYDDLRHTNGFFPYVGTVVPASLRLYSAGPLYQRPGSRQVHVAAGEPRLQFRVQGQRQSDAALEHALDRYPPKRVGCVSHRQRCDEQYPRPDQLWPRQPCRSHRDRQPGRLQVRYGSDRARASDRHRLQVLSHRRVAGQRYGPGP
jgi:outer membrane receptor protein involved in Fe transport